MADRSLVRRMRRAAALDAAVFEEVERDPHATPQALGVVTLGAVAGSVGASRTGLLEIAGGAAHGLAGWLVFAGLVYVLGEKVFGGQAGWGEVLRPVGFAQTPAVVGVFAFLPLVGWLVDTLVVLWILGASVVAIRASMGLPSERAALTAVLAGSLWALFALVV